MGPRIHTIISPENLKAYLSRFFLGQAVGGIIFPPYSESFGRKNLYIFSITGFAAFSIIIPTIHSLAAVYIGRFMTGFFSAIPSIVAAGSIEDVFNEKTRMWLVSVWLIVANLSLVIGPIFAAYVSSSIGWYDFVHVVDECLILTSLK